MTRRCSALSMPAVLAALVLVSPCCSPAEGAEAGRRLPDLSLYQLDHVFRDSTGKERRLADFRGEPTLIAMMFTHCAYACPALVADIGRVVAELGSVPCPRVLLVSMDSRRDTPDVLAAYAKEHAFDLSRYTLLHADPDAVAELAAVLDVRYAQVGDDFTHSNVITLLDRDGRIEHRQDGLGADPAPMVSAIARVAR